jgi:hypothetical protein
MKHPLSLFLPVIVTLIVNTCHADDTVLINSSYIFTYLNYNAARITLSVDPNLDLKDGNNKESPSVNKHGIFTGAVLIACGAALGYTGHKLGKEYYARYKKSAFTENTDILRKEVVGCNMLRIGGAVVAGTGVLVIVFSF